MKYSLNLILEKSRVDKQKYIYYDNKKENTYGEVRLWDGESESLDRKEILYVTSVETYFQWTDKEITEFPENCALVLTDEKNQWNVQYMQYQNRLLKMKSNLVIIKNITLVRSCNLLADSIHFLNHVVETFRNAVIDHRELQYIIELFYDFMGNPAYIVDSSFKVLAIDRRNNMRELSASWRRMEDNGYLQYDIVAKMMKDNELSEMESSDKAQWVSSEHFYTPFINYNLRRKKKLTGHLFIINMFRQITRGDIELSNILGSLIEKAMETDQKYQTKRGRLYEYFLSDILSGKMTDREEIKRQMFSLGYPAKCFYLVVILDSQDVQLNEIAEERLFQLLEQLKGCKPIHYEDKIAGLFPFKKNEEEKYILKKIAEITENFRIQAGISEAVWGYDQLHICTQQAMAALEFGEGQEKRVWYFEKCVMIYLYKKIFSGKDIQILKPFGLRRLRDYDKQNHTAYTETLLSYLWHERNVVETSRDLFIHRNTLTYRINKIVEITGLDMDDPVLRLRILLTCMRKDEM